MWPCNWDYFLLQHMQSWLSTNHVWKTTLATVGKLVTSYLDVTANPVTVRTHTHTPLPLFLLPELRLQWGKGGLSEREHLLKQSTLDDLLVSSLPRPGPLFFNTHHMPQFNATEYSVVIYSGKWTMRNTHIYRWSKWEGWCRLDISEFWLASEAAKPVSLEQEHFEE